jgi:integrase
MRGRVLEVQLLSWASLSSKHKNTARLGEKTVRRHTDRPRPLFRWAVDQHPPLIERDPTRGKTPKQRRKAPAREAFSPDELQTLLSGYVFNGQPAPTKWNVLHASAFWLVPLCLYTGLRAAEAVGLRLDDIGEDHGMHFVRVAEYESPQGDKTVKTHAALRVVPIHSALVRAGLIEHVAAPRKQKGRTRLLEDWQWRENGGYGAPAGDWFRAYATHCGVYKTTRKTLHGLRHNFAQSLARADVHALKIKELLGHAAAGVMEQHFLGRRALTELRGAVEVADFQIDPSALNFTDFSARLLDGSVRYTYRNAQSKCTPVRR